jgi:hypothetical protein
LLRLAAVGDNAAMSDSGIVLTVTALIVLPLAWIEWTRRRKDRNKPFQFSMRWIFGLAAWICVIAWTATQLRDRQDLNVVAMIFATLCIGAGIACAVCRIYAGTAAWVFLAIVLVWPWLFFH